jgi:genome maintenance exonuclease 1
MNSIYQNSNFIWDDRFNDLKIPKLKQINEKDKPRYYLLDEDFSDEEKLIKYYSVTSVLGSDPKTQQAIQNWKNRIGETEANKISSFTAGRGTKVHSLLEKYIKGEEIVSEEILPHFKNMFLTGIPKLDKNLSKIFFLEKKLFSFKLRLGGTADGIVEWNGIPSILDFKTSKKQKRKEYIQNYFLQCTAYACMFNELTNYNIEQLVVFIMNEEDDSQVFIENVSNFKPELLKRLYYFYKNKNDLILPPIFAETF